MLGGPCRGLELFIGFSSFTNLSRLDIKSTEIKKLGQEFRENMNSGIKHIGIFDAKTSLLEDGVFDQLQKLEWLEITYGKISFLKRNMFPSNPTELWILNFNGNQLSTLPTDIFNNMPKLEMVSLSDNQFTTIDEEIFGDLYRRAEVSLDFMNDPMICDCKMRWFLPKLRFRSITGSCMEPPAMKGKSFNFMTEEDFSYCNEVLRVSEELELL